VYQAAANGEVTSQLIREQLGQNFPESKLRKVFGSESQYDVKRSVSEVVCPAVEGIHFWVAQLFTVFAVCKHRVYLCVRVCVYW
jgi:hypothetical protein